MPLKPVKSAADKESNFHELRHGKTFARTAKNFGTNKARAQMVAIELGKEHESGYRPRSKKKFINQK